MVTVAKRMHAKLRINNAEAILFNAVESIVYIRNNFFLYRHVVGFETSVLLKMAQLSIHYIHLSP